MWNSIFMKAIRWILFIPFCLLALGLIQYLLVVSVIGIAALKISIFWLIVGFAVLGGILWSIFQMISMGISMLTVFFCPNHKVGGYILSVFSIITFVYLVFKLWMIPVHYNLQSIVFCIVVTVFYSELFFTIVGGALAPSSQETI